MQAGLTEVHGRPRDIIFRAHRRPPFSLGSRIRWPVTIWINEIHGPAAAGAGRQGAVMLVLVPSKCMMNWTCCLCRLRTRTKVRKGFGSSSCQPRTPFSSDGALFLQRTFPPTASGFAWLKTGRDDSQASKGKWGGDHEPCLLPLVLTARLCPTRANRPPSPRSMTTVSQRRDDSHVLYIVELSSPPSSPAMDSGENSRIHHQPGRDAGADTVTRGVSATRETGTCC